jgi:hypothetical protein
MVILEHCIVAPLSVFSCTVPIFNTASSLTNVFVDFGRVKALGKCLTLWITVYLSAHVGCLSHREPSDRSFHLMFAALPSRELARNQDRMRCLNTRTFRAVVTADVPSCPTKLSGPRATRKTTDLRLPQIKDWIAFATAKNTRGSGDCDTPWTYPDT